MMDRRTRHRQSQSIFSQTLFVFPCVSFKEFEFNWHRKEEKQNKCQLDRHRNTHVPL